MKDLLFKKAFEFINQANYILLVAHVNPDGDAISSVCAMAEYLKTRDKKYYTYCYNQPPHQFDFLACVREFNFKIKEDKSENTELGFDFHAFDLIIALDCGSLERTTLADEIKNRQERQKVIEFDHHPKFSDFADIELRDTSSSSTSEVVYDFFKANHIRLNKNIAQAILTGISTDTGNFLYPSTSDKTVKIASEMLVYGANLPRIVENTWRNKSITTMKVWGKIMANLKINEKYKIAFTVLTLTDMEQISLSGEELEGITNFLGNLKGVKGVMFLRQLEKNKIRGSIRTADPHADISKLAKLFGGGGHPKASGFTIEGELVETEKGWKVV